MKFNFEIVVPSKSDRCVADGYGRVVDTISIIAEDKQDAVARAWVHARKRGPDAWVHAID